MKITQKQLRQIIKEELAHSMDEMGGVVGGDDPTPEDAFDAVMYMYESDPDQGTQGDPYMYIEDIAIGLDVTVDKAFRLIYQAGGMTRNGKAIRPNRKGDKVFIVDVF